jgi:uncharacterized protein with HEPN domain
MYSKEHIDEFIHAVLAARHNAELINQWAGGMDYHSLSADVMRCYAVQYAFIAISEAMDDIPSPLLQNYAPAGLWRAIKAFRNFLAHTYDDLPDRRIIDTISIDLPYFVDVLNTILIDLEAKKS